MATGPWAKATTHVNRLIEARRAFSGVAMTLQRQEKDYTANYWRDCFASPVFRRKGLVEITKAVQDAYDTTEKLEATMSGSITDSASSLNSLLQTLSQAVGTQKGTVRAELRKSVLRWKLSEFTDLKHAKVVRTEAVAFAKEHRKSVKELGKPAIKALSAFVSALQTYIKEVIPLRKYRRQVSETKQYAQLLLDATHSIEQTTAAHNASNPVDATDANRTTTYRSLTRLLSKDERSEIDDWKDDLGRIGSMLGDLKNTLDENIKLEARTLAIRERQKTREELERLMVEDEAPVKVNKKRKSLEEIQEELAEDADREDKKKALEQALKGDREERELNKFDEDIEHIKELGAQTKLLSKAKFGFVEAGVIATNSYVSDPIGVTHLKRNKIKWKWVAKSYILFENAKVFGWRTSLAEKGNFDPVFLLRRIKRKKPKSLWAQKDYQIWTPQFVRRGDYTYALVMPAIKSNSPSLNEDRDITVRNWDFAAST